uniref:Si:dkeyp-34f6.4 n=2 Tax=Haplochromini TaxID=319058 RepID=A0A3B4G1D2_9CICH
LVKNVFIFFLVLFRGSTSVALAPILVVLSRFLALHFFPFLPVKVFVPRKLDALQALLSGLGMSLYMLTAGEQLAADVAAERAHT